MERGPFISFPQARIIFSFPNILVLSGSGSGRWESGFPFVSYSPGPYFKISIISESKQVPREIVCFSCLS